jgi:2-keto-4-pentenoate hydratase/2-oxohepta-3-ene-1,7-dioic acid hydratase in catechol pathway
VAAGIAWDPRLETPLDALLRAGLAGALLDRIGAERDAAAAAAPRPSAPAPPVVRPGKILALGRTYREHAAELGNPHLGEPLVFVKLADGLVGTGATVRIPARADRMDYEAEVAVVVGKRAEALPDGNGRAVIAGVAPANDLTLRSLQKAAQKAGHPWLLAKNFAGACALGPWMSLVEPGTDLDRLLITCRVNGEVRQSASTAGLMRPVGALVEWISHVIPLNPGDVILTGTPAGTGPLRSGDVCEVSITDDSTDLGTLVTTVA